MVGTVITKRIYKPEQTLLQPLYYRGYKWKQTPFLLASSLQS